MIESKPAQPALRVAARTDTGLRRAQNEDQLLAADPCFLVADGMGGHEAGAEASRTAIAAFSEEFTAPGPADLQRIDRALAGARTRVAAIAARSPRGAGCTLTGVIRIVHEGQPHWYVLNIGDSRVYLFRRNELLQLTEDHSLRSERLNGGVVGASLTPRNVITRALGSDDSRHDAWLLPVEDGSRLLVCSDGLSIEIDDAGLAAALAAEATPETVVERLLRSALDAGGRDNITLIVVDVLAGGAVLERRDGETADQGESDDELESTLPTGRPLGASELP